MAGSWARLSALVGVMLVVAGTVGCGVDEAASVEVQLRVSVCADGDGGCFALGVPDAEVSMVDPGGQVLATGRSDAAGKTLLPRNDATGEVRIIAVSPLIEGGRKESPLVLPGEGGANITIGAGRTYSPAGD
ncbi:hypothetical protein O7608_07580 [Solwaraspora sp. WMMA2056]|uniref:hypothetical protein n=1 Tax=Solwaraspora sp. WMMA2056 TaxID=3015161 RepID=UPI00259B5436|nr:hypothetical protein [Solwaraspora sp. WMMA2056]WJK42238.1 hypothetical protein O7608_07580 [Solwaraspora sp. WMMA2056]